MDTQEEIYNLLQQIADDLVALPGKLLLMPNQIKIDTGLSDMSETLGMIQAGEFRSGNGKEPNMGFSGVRIAYPPMLYNSTNWNLVGIENDVLQFGVRASDGKLIAGGGAVVLDTSGITATAGTIGGWTINATTITGAKITLDSTGSIQAGFVSNVSGWRILQDGTAEFNNISVRGEIKSAVFTYDSVQAMAGSMGVFKSAGVVMTDAVVPADATNFNVDIDDPAFGHFQLFAVNDLVRVKFGTTSTWFKVMVATDMTTFWRYALSKQSGTASYTIRAGTPVVDYGVSGDGIIWMTADDTNGPFISVATHAGAPWTTQTEQVRIGNLAGIGSLTGYGWAVGNPSLAQYAYYTPATGLLIKGEVNATAGWFGNSDTRVDAYGVRIFSGVNEVARLGNLNTYLGYVTDVYGLGIGQVGTNKPNLVFDTTDGLRIRNNVTDVLKFDVSGNAIISGKLKMDQTGSAIAIGTTPPTSATAGTGIWIDRTGLYGLNANVQQAYLRASDGYMIAGGGKLRLTSTGLEMYDDVSVNSSIKFYEASLAPGQPIYQIGRIMGDWGGTAPQDAVVWVSAFRQSGDPWNRADIVLIAQDYVTSKEARVTLRTDGVMTLTGTVQLAYVSASPAAEGSRGAIYAKTDDQLYFKNDNGTEYRLNEPSIFNWFSRISHHIAFAGWTGSPTYMPGDTGKIKDWLGNHHITYRGTWRTFYFNNPVKNMVLLDLNGTTDYHNYSPATELQPFNTDWCYAVWFYADAVGRFNGIVGFGDTTFSQGLYSHNTTNHLTWKKYNAAGTAYEWDTGITITAGAWHCVVAYGYRIDASIHYSKIQVDNTAVEFSADPGDIRTPAGSFVLGKMETSFLDGVIGPGFVMLRPGDPQIVFDFYERTKPLFDL